MSNPFELAHARAKSIPELSFEALAREVDNFQTNLAEACEVGILVNGTSVIHVQSIRYAGAMVVFEGTDNQGRVARLIQHYTQVNVQMISVEALTETPNRIGF